MKKLLVACLLLMSFVPFGATLAYPFCGPSQPPNQPSAFCRYDLIANDTYRLAPGVQFAWLRTEPSSIAGVRATVWPSAGASLVTVGGVAHWDGVQWWYEVSTYPDRRVSGWVERVSLAQVVLQPAPLPPTPTAAPLSDPSIQEQAPWSPPFQGRVEVGVPFLWMREGPNSGRVVATLGPGEQFVVTNWPQFDGYQWWWPVADIHRTRGWIEQGSITPLG